MTLLVDVKTFHDITLAKSLTHPEAALETEAHRSSKGSRDPECLVQTVAQGSDRLPVAV